MQPSLANRPRQTNKDYTWAEHSIAGGYTVDLLVSLALVLIVVEVLRTTPTQEVASIWAMNLHAAVSRFTPFGLWEIYRQEVVTTITGLGYAAGASALPNVLLGAEFLLRVLVAAPATLVVIWQKTDNFSDWITLVGFAGILFCTFAVLVTGGRLTLVRLLGATFGSPLLAVGLFWMAQQTFLDVMNGFNGISASASWFLLAPIACTLYRVMFPQAEYCATVAFVHALGRLRTGAGRYPRHGNVLNATSLPRTRK